MEVTISKKQIMTFGSYSLVTLGIMTPYMFLNTFMTEVIGISAATLGAVLLVAKVIDFIVSVLAGVIIEKIKLPGNSGKYQSWVRLGRYVITAGVLLCMVDTTSCPMWLRVIICFCGYVLLNCFMNLVQTAYYGLMPLVGGPNPANRNAMIISMTRQMTVVMLVTSLIAWLVTVLTPYVGSWSYFCIAVVFIIPTPFALSAIAKLGDGLDKPLGQGNAGMPPVTLGDMLKTLTQNPQMLVLFTAYTILYIGMYVYMAIYSYYFLFVVGNFALMTVASLICGVVGIVAAMIFPPIGIKIGKKWATVFGFGIFAIGLFFVYLFGANSWIYYVVFFSVASCGTYLYQAFGITMFMDCGEWYLHKTGKDTRGIAAALFSPPMKIGMAVGGSIGTFGLAWTGYTAGGNFIPDAAWSSKFMLICWLIPAILYAVAALLVAVGYKITDKDAARMAQENAEKMASMAGTAGVPSPEESSPEESSPEA